MEHIIVMNMKEEVRSGYLVTEKTKRIWAVELDLLRKFDEVCRKYGLKYYAMYGTLLGAVRHGGFIPWDDDIDLCMLRDDYEKLKLIAKDEFTEKYFFQDWYNACGRTWLFSKLRNSETTAVEFPDKGPEFNQGIFLDIFPFDEFDDGNADPVFKAIQRELFDCINNPVEMLKGVLAGKQYTMSVQDIMKYTEDYISAERVFDQLTLENMGQSDFVGLYSNEVRGNGLMFLKSVFREAIYYPFEDVRIPVPIGYHDILTKYYGDYMTPVQLPSDHTDRIILDPDKPYTEYLTQKISNKL